MTKLALVVDGAIYEMQPFGGISRIFSETLPRMCALDPLLEATLFTSGRPAQSLPEHPHLRVKRLPRVESFLRPRRLWRPIEPTISALVQRLWLGDSRDKIWHSTYYTMPERWHGTSVVTVADLIYERFPELFATLADREFRELKRRSIAAADAVICISETTREDVLRFHDIEPQRLHVVPLAYNTSFRKLPAIPAEGGAPVAGAFLLYVGNRRDHKNFPWLLRSYGSWRARDAAPLVVVGWPWSPDEQSELRRLGLEGKVHLLSGVNDAHLGWLYNQAAAFLYPSLYEGFGVPVLEAMACGCPVVASRIPSTVEVAGESPIYFELNDPASLHAVLDQALVEGRDSPRVHFGLQWVQRYSWDKTAESTLRVYRSL